LGQGEKEEWCVEKFCFKTYSESHMVT